MHWHVLVNNNRYRDNSTVGLTVDQKNLLFLVLLEAATSISLQPVAITDTKIKPPPNPSER
jgi:hypothetical protein